MNVLIVDDDPVSRCVLQKILSTEADCEVSEAECGGEAWVLMQNPALGFDVVFLDISMPDFDGLELLQRVLESPLLKRLHVILCTSAQDRATVTRAAAIGARHYVVKPASAAVVKAKLQQIRDEMAKGGSPSSYSAA